MTIDHVITHGATDAVDGTLVLANGTEYAFCDVYEFGSHGKNARLLIICWLEIALVNPIMDCLATAFDTKFL